MKPATPVMSHVFGSSSKAARTSLYRLRVAKGVICFRGLSPLRVDIIIGAIEFGERRAHRCLHPSFRRGLAQYFSPPVDTTKKFFSSLETHTRVELKGESI
jgi:hypothetical protein